MITEEEKRNIQNETLRMLIEEYEEVPRYDPSIHITAIDYASVFGVQVETARKRLERLAQQGKLVVIRVHLPGGHIGRAYIKASQ